VPTSTVPLGVRQEQRERIADWLIALGAVALFVSLSLPWSHQLSPDFLLEWSATSQLRGVPHSPTAWQVYSIADVILALLAVALLAGALRGGRTARLVLVAASGVAVAFAAHALSTPPTNGADIYQSALNTPGYVPNDPASAAGPLLALIALGIALLGLSLSFTAD
jgi:hypothetical protein